MSHLHRYILCYNLTLKNRKCPLSKIVSVMPAYKSAAEKRNISEDINNDFNHQACIEKYKASKGCVVHIVLDVDKWLEADPQALEKISKRKKLEKMRAEGLYKLAMEYVIKLKDYQCIITGPIMQNSETKPPKEHLNLLDFKTRNGWF